MAYKTIILTSFLSLNLCSLAQKMPTIDRSENKPSEQSTTLPQNNVSANPTTTSSSPTSTPSKTKPTTKPIQNELTLSTSYIKAQPEGSMQKITISSSQNWTFKTDDNAIDWITASKSYNDLAITINQNLFPIDREAKITVISGDLQKQISIYQSGDHSESAKNKYEEYLYNVACQSESITSLQYYLQNYPHGKYSCQADKKIHELRGHNFYLCNSYRYALEEFNLAGGKKYIDQKYVDEYYCCEIMLRVTDPKYKKSSHKSKKNKSLYNNYNKPQPTQQPKPSGRPSYTTPYY